MLPIVLTSVIPFSGKNVVGLGMARKFRADGRAVGYFKPIGPLPVWEGDTLTDQDTQFFKKVLNLSEPLEALCPVVLDDETIASLLRDQGPPVRERIQHAFQTVAEGNDIVIVYSMGRLSSGLALGYSMAEFIEAVDARVVVVNHFRWPVETLDGLLNMQEALGSRLAGVVFNHIPAVRRSQIEKAVCPFLADHRIDVFGIVPEDTLLRAVSVRQIVENLNGQVLCCGDKLEELAEQFSIGAMNAQAALRFFRRVPNKAVITGGDRPDIHLAALETQTRCLILTGGLYPNERILTRAEELGVPVILVAADTSTTAEVCERIQSRMSLRSERKAARVAEVMEKHLDWDLMYRNLGIT